MKIRQYIENYIINFFRIFKIKECVKKCLRKTLCFILMIQRKIFSWSLLRKSILIQTLIVEQFGQVLCDGGKCIERKSKTKRKET